MTSILLEHANRHRALAASARLANATIATTEFTLADAFYAAVAELDHDDVDDEGTFVPDDALA